MNHDSKSALLRVNTQIRSALREADAAMKDGDWNYAHAVYLHATALASSAAASAEINAEKAGG